MHLVNSQRPLVLIVAAKWWPLSARMAIAFLREGCRVYAVCPPMHPLTYVSGMDGIRPYSSTNSLTSLRRSMSEWRPDVVVPCDDGVVAQLHALHRQEPTLRDLIERSLGPSASYSIISSRKRLLSISAELGIVVPKTIRIGEANDLVRWHEETAPTGVLKVDGESGGNGVRICNALDESLAAWRELSVRCSGAAAWKRVAIDRDPLALWMRQNPGEREITMQAFIGGRPANSMLACQRGEVLSLISVVVVAADGPTGAATIVRRIRDERMTQAAKLLAARLQLTGFYGLDFMIDANTGVPYLIELNPRCTQLGHLELPDQGSLAGVFSAALRSKPRPRPKQPIRNGTIALFPQALAAGDACRPYVEASYHDVPRGEPQLVDELKLGPWPQRQWAARLYHALRPIPPQNPTVFDNRDSTVGAKEACTTK
jgi:ATP-grasp domain